MTSQKKSSVKDPKGNSPTAERLWDVLVSKSNIGDPTLTSGSALQVFKLSDEVKGAEWFSQDSYVDIRRERPQDDWANAAACVDAMVRRVAWDSLYRHALSKVPADYRTEIFPARWRRLMEQDKDQKSMEVFLLWVGSSADVADGRTLGKSAATLNALWKAHLALREGDAEGESATTIPIKLLKELLLALDNAWIKDHTAVMGFSQQSAEDQWAYMLTVLAEGAMCSKDEGWTEIAGRFLKEVHRRGWDNLWSAVWSIDPSIRGYVRRDNDDFVTFEEYEVTETAWPEVQSESAGPEVQMEATIAFGVSSPPRPLSRPTGESVPRDQPAHTTEGPGRLSAEDRERYAEEDRTADLPDSWGTHPPSERQYQRTYDGPPSGVDPNTNRYVRSADEEREILEFQNRHPVNPLEQPYRSFTNTDRSSWDRAALGVTERTIQQIGLKELVPHLGECPPDMPVELFKFLVTLMEATPRSALTLLTPGSPTVSYELAIIMYGAIYEELIKTELMPSQGTRKRVRDPLREFPFDIATLWSTETLAHFLARVRRLFWWISKVPPMKHEDGDALSFTREARQATFPGRSSNAKIANAWQGLRFGHGNELWATLESWYVKADRPNTPGERKMSMTELRQRVQEHFEVQAEPAYSNADLNDAMDLAILATLHRGQLRTFDIRDPPAGTLWPPMASETLVFPSFLSWHPQGLRTLYDYWFNTVSNFPATSAIAAMLTKRRGTQEGRTTEAWRDIAERFQGSITFPNGRLSLSRPHPAGWLAMPHRVKRSYKPNSKGYTLVGDGEMGARTINIMNSAKLALIWGLCSRLDSASDVFTDLFTSHCTRIDLGIFIVYVVLGQCALYLNPDHPQHTEPNVIRRFLPVELVEPLLEFMQDLLDVWADGDDNGTFKLPTNSLDTGIQWASFAQLSPKASLWKWMPPLSKRFNAAITALVEPEGAGNVESCTLGVFFKSVFVELMQNRRQASTCNARPLEKHFRNPFLDLAAAVPEFQDPARLRAVFDSGSINSLLSLFVNAGYDDMYLMGYKTSGPRGTKPAIEARTATWDGKHGTRWSDTPVPSPIKATPMKAQTSRPPLGTWHGMPHTDSDDEVEYVENPMALTTDRIIEGDKVRKRSGTSINQERATQKSRTETDTSSVHHNEVADTPSQRMSPDPDGDLSAALRPPEPTRYNTELTAMLKQVLEANTQVVCQAIETNAQEARNTTGMFTQALQQTSTLLQDLTAAVQDIRRSTETESRQLKILGSTVEATADPATPEQRVYVCAGRKFTVNPDEARMVMVRLENDPVLPMSALSIEPEQTLKNACGLRVMCESDNPDASVVRVLVNRPQDLQEGTLLGNWSLGPSQPTTAPPGPPDPPKYVVIQDTVSLSRGFNTYVRIDELYDPVTGQAVALATVEVTPTPAMIAQGVTMNISGSGAWRNPGIILSATRGNVRLDMGTEVATWEYRAIEATANPRDTPPTPPTARGEPPKIPTQDARGNDGGDTDPARGHRGPPGHEDWRLQGRGGRGRGSGRDGAPARENMGYARPFPTRPFPTLHPSNQPSRWNQYTDLGEDEEEDDGDGDGATWNDADRRQWGAFVKPETTLRGTSLRNSSASPAYGGDHTMLDEVIQSQNLEQTRLKRIVDDKRAKAASDNAYDAERGFKLVKELLQETVRKNKTLFPLSDQWGKIHPAKWLQMLPMLVKNCATYRQGMALPHNFWHSLVYEMMCPELVAIFTVEVQQGLQDSPWTEPEQSTGGAAGAVDFVTQVDRMFNGQSKGRSACLQDVQKEMFGERSFQYLLLRTMEELRTTDQSNELSIQQREDKMLASYAVSRAEWNSFFNTVNIMSPWIPHFSAQLLMRWVYKKMDRETLKEIIRHCKKAETWEDCKYGRMRIFPFDLNGQVTPAEHECKEFCLQLLHALKVYLRENQLTTSKEPSKVNMVGEASTEEKEPAKEKEPAARKVNFAGPPATTPEPSDPPVTMAQFKLFAENLLKTLSPGIATFPRSTTPTRESLDRPASTPFDADRREMEVNTPTYLQGSGRAAYQPADARRTPPSTPPRFSRPPAPIEKTVQEGTSGAATNEPTFPLSEADLAFYRAKGVCRWTLTGKTCYRKDKGCKFMHDFKTCAQGFRAFLTQTATGLTEEEFKSIEELLPTDDPGTKAAPPERLFRALVLLRKEHPSDSEEMTLTEVLDHLELLTVAAEGPEG